MTLEDAREAIKEHGFEEIVVDKLFNIQGRISTIETSMTWFKFIARGSVIVVLGFFGFDATGMI